MHVMNFVPWSLVRDSDILGMGYLCQLASPNQLPLNWPPCVVLHHLPLLLLLHLFYLHFPLILLLASFIYAYI